MRTRTTTPALTHAPHGARITGPVPYVMRDGKASHIPLGPCLVEQAGNDLVDIVWGTQGQNLASLPVERVRSAAELGHLVLLD